MWYVLCLMPHLSQTQLSGLESIHARGIVHRDIKPENTVMAKHGVVKICAFGSAEVRGRMQHGPVGTVQYLAPELYDCVCEHVDACGD